MANHDKAAEVEKDQPLPLPRDIYGDGTVNIIVGPQGDEKTFSVHKALIMHHSGFFRGAFASENFQEGTSGEIKLGDVDHDVFSIFLDWLYKQELASAVKWGLLYGVDISLRDQPLAELYILADRYIIPDLKAHALNLAILNYDVPATPPSYGTITAAFENLPEDDLYLQLLVDTHCLFGGEPARKDGSSAAYIEGLSSLPSSFVLRAMSKYADMSANARKVIIPVLDRSAYGIKMKMTDSGASKKKKLRTTT